jgi:hypothetical protein
MSKDGGKMKTPTLKQKVQQYENLFHLINTMMIACDNEGIKKLLSNIDNWSYMHRVGNGELSEKEQQVLINKAFWKLTDLE